MCELCSHHRSFEIRDHAKNQVTSSESTDRSTVQNIFTSESI